MYIAALVQRAHAACACSDAVYSDSGDTGAIWLHHSYVPAPSVAYPLARTAWGCSMQLCAVPSPMTVNEHCCRTHASRRTYAQSAEAVCGSDGEHRHIACIWARACQGKGRSAYVCIVARAPSRSAERRVVCGLRYATIV